MYDQIIISTPDPGIQISNQSEFAITPKEKVVNRQQSRQFDKNAKSAVRLQTVIDEFMDALYTAPPEIEYRTIYVFYLDAWNEAMNKVKPRLKNVKVDDQFFTQQFAPVI